jgi:hypothetical protein
MYKNELAYFTAKRKFYKTGVSMGEELKHFIDTLTSFAFILAFIFFLTALALGHDWLDALGPIL